MTDARAEPDDLAEHDRQRAFVSNVRKAIARGPSLWLDLCRAVAELALANLKVRRSEPASLGVLETSAAFARQSLTMEEERLVDRVAYALTAMANRVPWRSDCLIQAVAARRWLASGGVKSRIGIGARGGDGGAMVAHAWLKVGDRIVTGGDISAYGEFIRALRDHDGT